MSSGAFGCKEARMKAVFVFWVFFKFQTHWHIQQHDFDTKFRLTEICQVADIISEKCDNDLQ